MSRTKVLVFGGSGFVGRELVRQLQNTDWALPVVVSRSPQNLRGVESVAFDVRDASRLREVLRNADTVVNCVAGDSTAIINGASNLVDAALYAGKPRMVHMSSMSVYGRAEGLIDESFPLQDDIGWYGHAKIVAEQHMRRYAAEGGEVVIFRPGCVVGLQSSLWVRRIGVLLKNGRLGNLGAGGDGPANLVDVADVAQAAVRALQFPLSGKVAAFNLACPDSPRWNDYFADFALGIGALPLRTLGERRMKLDAYAIGVPVKILEKILVKLGSNPKLLPESIPPSLLGLWRQQIQLNSEAVSASLQLRWTPYSATLTNALREFQKPFGG
jgi:nucleoside-diphosphate-sugar epimerase